MFKNFGYQAPPDSQYGYVMLSPSTALRINSAEGFRVTSKKLAHGVN